MDVKACAQMALDMTAQVTGRMDDKTLDAVVAMRSMLRCLVSGEFVVVTAAGPAQSNPPVPPGAEP